MWHTNRPWVVCPSLVAMTTSSRMGAGNPADHPQLPPALLHRYTHTHTLTHTHTRRKRAAGVPKCVQIAFCFPVACKNFFKEIRLDRLLYPVRYYLFSLPHHPFCYKPHRYSNPSTMQYLSAFELLHTYIYCYFIILNDLEKVTCIEAATRFLKTPVFKLLCQRMLTFNEIYGHKPLCTR